MKTVSPWETGPITPEHRAVQLDLRLSVSSHFSCSRVLLLDATVADVFAVTTINCSKVTVSREQRLWLLSGESRLNTYKGESTWGEFDSYSLARERTRRCEPTSRLFL